MIRLAYDLEKNDFLNSQLYVLSIDENFKKQQKKEKYRIVGITLLFACILFFDESYRTTSYFFFATSVLYFLFYPWWAAWYYKRMYRQQIERHFENSLPYHMEIDLLESSINVRTTKGNQQIAGSRLSFIKEIKDYFFIVEDISFTTIIIPKESLQDENTVRDMLMSYTRISNAKYSSDLDWKWK